MLYVFQNRLGMSWLRKICQCKPMALPFDRTELPERPNYTNKDEVGVRVIDKKMRDDTAKKEQENWDPHYLGSGSFGVAVDLGNNIVGKYTEDPYEADMASHIMHKNLPCFPKIFSVDQIQNDLWRINMERVTPLGNRFDPELVPMLRWALETSQNAQILENKIDKLLTRFDENEGTMKLVSDYCDMAKCFLANDIKSHDAHEHNVGYTSDGRLVLFDLGLSNLVPNRPELQDTVS